jgi:hypothetical protein
MSQLIAWCGFVGAWFVVLGPLNQAMREIGDEEFERDVIARAAREVEVPTPVSVVVGRAAPLLHPPQASRSDLQTTGSRRDVAR